MPSSNQKAYEEKAAQMQADLDASNKRLGITPFSDKYGRPYKAGKKGTKRPVGDYRGLMSGKERGMLEQIEGEY